MASTTAPTNVTVAEAPGGAKKYTPALSALTSLFFMWGFLTCLNDILIPHLKAVFSLNYAQAMLVQFVFFAAYFVVSIPSGALVKKVGYKRGIVIGLVGAGIGCLLFYPAASLRSYPVFLSAFFVLASGITLLQVAANPYVAILGRPETSSSRLNLTQAFNSLGTTIAPHFGSVLILSVAVKSASDIEKLSAAERSAYQAAEASAVQLPYVVLAVVLFVIAGIMALLRLPAIKDEAPAASDAAASLSGDADRRSAWAYPHLVYGALAIFLYVGGEVAIGSFLVNFLGHPTIAGLSEEAAGKFVSYYWGGAMVGRFIGSAVMRRVPPGTLLGLNALVAATLVVVTILSSGRVAMWSVLAVGLFNSIMFPTIFTLALQRLGRHTSQGSGILCAAIVGGAIVPYLQGLLADRVGIQHAFVLPVLCYLYIAFYGLRGSKAGAVAAKAPAAEPAA